MNLVKCDDAHRRIRRSVRGWLVALLALSATASAQVPPHPPGTICFTPTFWCWMQFPGIPGQLCYCPSPWGPVQGVIG
jgi:hypothetical protein